MRWWVLVVHCGRAVSVLCDRYLQRGEHSSATLSQRVLSFFSDKRRRHLLVASSRTDIWYLFVSVFFFLFLKAPILFSSFESCLVKISIYCKGLTAGGDGGGGGGVVVFFFTSASDTEFFCLVVRF